LEIKLCEKRKALLVAPGHILAVGGPGSGKTTIALLKAKEKCQYLKPGQDILFLSFSKSAVRQILGKCKNILTVKQRTLIEVSTYHRFCLEVLESHGRLLCGRKVRFLFPWEERLKKSTFDGDWENERTKLADEECLYCFDLVASGVATLFEQCKAVLRLYSNKYPLIIVDEFQDTDNDQWRIVKAFMKVTDVFCLADPEQRIFDYRPNVDPRRIELLREYTRPKEFDLGTDNHRSPATGILQFADAILQNRVPLPSTENVKLFEYKGRNFDSYAHAVVIWTFSKLRKMGIDKPCVAVLCRTNPFVAKLSILLDEQHTFKGNVLKPIDHDVLWDAELAAASAQVVASILEWPSKINTVAIQDTLSLIAQFYKVKNSESSSNSSADNIRKYEKATEAIKNGDNPRIKVGKEILKIVGDGIKFVGDPVKDWVKGRLILKNIKALNELFREAKMMRLFRATDALGSNLANKWVVQGNYAGAVNMVKRILDRERLLSTERDPKGCVLMTLHKSKGKEFDGVVLIEGSYTSTFFDQYREDPPYIKSRRLLRVGITRASSIVTILRPENSQPLVG
jgi:DNA helicase-2/ATP-dependent DNA helicase PcrA